MFSINSTKTNTSVTYLVIFLVRIFVGFSMITHGYPKLVKLLGEEEIEFFNFLGLGAEVSLVLVVFSEFICSIFIILGLFTRWALFFLVITMAVAGILVHGSDPFSDQEMSLLYLAVYLLMFATGPGKFSVDYMISSRKNSNW